MSEKFFELKKKKVDNFRIEKNSVKNLETKKATRKFLKLFKKQTKINNYLP